MMRTRSGLRIFSGKPDFICLIDIFFLLFIFFLVSTSLVFQPGIPVDLPSAYGRSASAAEKIIVTISSDSKIFLNDQPVPDYELQRLLRETVENRTAFTVSRLNLQDSEEIREHRPRIVIRADRRVPYEKIIEVMSLARSIGLGVFLITDQEPPISLRRPQFNNNHH